MAKAIILSTVEVWRSMLTVYLSSKEAPHITSPADWKLEKGEMVVVPGAGHVVTKELFGDVQLHIEWLAPKNSTKSGQDYSNSGLFFMGLYEVQILNSYDNETYSNGQAGASL